MNASRVPVGRSLRVGSVVAVAALTLLVPTIAAQDGDELHPAHIHTGTCAELGDVVFPLTDVEYPSGEEELVGPASAIPVKSSWTLVDAPLRDIIDGGHAINVHLSAEEIGTYIACGDIGGVVTVDEGEEEEELIIGLRELNGSGHTGVAWLGAEGDQTRVSIRLVEPGTEGDIGAEAAQEATPVSAEAVTVEIAEYKFDPDTLSVPVGASVTWTNQDTVPHTATGLDRETLQSGSIALGESFTHQFDTAGTFDYFCEFHSGMKGSVVVE